MDGERLAARMADIDAMEARVNGAPDKDEAIIEEMIRLLDERDEAVAEVRRLTAALATARREGAELAETLVDTFWPTINAKRIDLIERDVAGTITQAESVLLAQLQAAAEVATRSLTAGLLAALPLDAPGGAT